jgi:hypothetical protein
MTPNANSAATQQKHQLIYARIARSLKQFGHSYQHGTSCKTSQRVTPPNRFVDGGRNADQRLTRNRDRLWMDSSYISGGTYGRREIEELSTMSPN